MMAPAENGRWRPVSQGEPCPACGHGDWCAWTPDGNGLRCMRGGETPAGMKEAKNDPDGWTLFLAGDRLSSRPGHARPRANEIATLGRARPSLDDLQNRFCKALTPERRSDLAARLGVTAAALDSIGAGWATASDLRTLGASGAGWAQDRPDGAFSFLERDGAGRLVGFSFRAADGRKGSPAGSSGAKRGLIVPANLHDDPGQRVLIVEGASDVAACCAIGLVAVGRPSNTGGAEHLAKLLGKRQVLVVGENDGKPTGAWPGRDGAEAIAGRLASQRGEPVKWSMPPADAKDVRAWLAARVAKGLNLDDPAACRAAGAELLEALACAAIESKPQKAASMADQLVRMALESYRFGRTEKDEPFAVAHDGPNVALLLSGSADAIRARLAKLCRQQTGKTPAAAALTDALNLLTGEALDGEAEPVQLRLAMHQGGIVIDIADGSGRAVMVSPGGWEVLDRSPILFRRTALTAALPIPERGGDLAELRELLNVRDDDWPLIVGFLVAAQMPGIPHPILLLTGMQGTGKSGAARVLSMLVDPSPAPLRSEPRDLDQWHIAAAGSWAVALDNLSSIQPWLADALCRAATGDGLVKRTLYSDSNLTVLSFRRVVILNTIDAGALRGDLGERLILVELEPIPEDSRRTEQEIEANLQGRQARLFGALLDALALVLAKLPDVRPVRLPRMADFGRVLAAADAAGVTAGAFSRFLAQQGRIATEVLDSDSFGSSLAEFMRGRREWEGTASELLAALLPGGDSKPPHGWPKRNVVKGRLMRLTPALTSVGIHVRCDRDSGHERRRVIRLTTRKSPDSIVQTVRSSEPEGPESRAPDDADDSDDHLQALSYRGLPAAEPAGVLDQVNRQLAEATDDPPKPPHLAGWLVERDGRVSWPDD